ncbi:putative chaperone protein DnaJ [Opisthorchis viverrini]|uniref:Putative chaperone protein DnaJ n=1 Tax=Opisthorchis viverrini TaxID=6198 RepID=A0A1S8WZ83_OPIVI|nr:putative chaperone protein DnaJ [Opisthorchis viverrini]
MLALRSRMALKGGVLWVSRFSGNFLERIHSSISCELQSFRGIHSTFAKKKDYYKILGVDRSASQADIKKAYYQLAKKYHPDVNKDDKDAAQKFQEVSEAYEILGDENKRKQYNSFGAASSGTGAQGRPQYSGFEYHSQIDPEELFRRIFRDSEFAFKEWTTGDRNFAETIFGFSPTKEIPVNLTFEQAARGANKEIAVNMPVACSRCGGSRAEPGTGTSTCPNCNGTGTEQLNTGPFLLRSICRRCQGSGSIVRYPCVECEGKGKVIARQRVNISIPAGVEDGQVLRVSVSAPRGESQEIFVQIRVERSRQFRREGADIHSDVVISLAQAALGGKMRVPGIYETMLISIPPGSASGDRIRLPGKGISRVNGYGYGDHYLHIKIQPPKRLTELQRALLLAYAETEQDVSGTVEGVTSTESGLDKLRKALLGDAHNSSSRRASTPDDSSDRSAHSQNDAPTDQSDSFLNRIVDGDRRAIDTTPGFLLSRIRASLYTNSDPESSKSEPQQPEIPVRKTRVSDKSIDTIL